MLGVSGPRHDTQSPHRLCDPRIQTANRPENASVESGQLVYPHPPRRTAQSAAPPSKSARNERSINAVVGGEIDRGPVDTEEEGL